MSQPNIEAPEGVEYVGLGEPENPHKDCDWALLRKGWTQRWSGHYDGANPHYHYGRSIQPTAREATGFRECDRCEHLGTQLICENLGRCRRENTEATRGSTAGEAERFQERAAQAFPVRPFPPPTAGSETSSREAMRFADSMCSYLKFPVGDSAWRQFTVEADHMISALKAELAEVRRVAGVMGRILEGFERGRDLWLPEIVSEEHYEEAHELHGLRDRMLAAMIEWVKLQPGEGR